MKCKKRKSKIKEDGFSIKMQKFLEKERPERHGKKWDKPEEDYILRRVSQNVSFETISKEVQRTVGGVYSHLKEIAYRLVKDENMLLEQASDITKVTILDIQDYIAKKDYVRKIKEEKNIFSPIQQDSTEKEETLLSVAIEIRDLLKELLKK